MNKDLLTVGELAKEMGVTVRTLQFYDKEGLLISTAKSEGGRRLYSKKDMVKLHQILSLKYLGFSLGEIKTKLLPLDSPEDVAQILSKQKLIIEEQIKELSTVAEAIDSLINEVVQMKEVNFNKYANIVALLRQNNKDYWMFKLFDEKLMNHIRDRFMDDPQRGMMFQQTYLTILDETIAMQHRGVSPESEQGLKLAKQWWDMIMDFTGGDFNLLPDLMKFNESKQGWDEKMAEKQKQADDFIGLALFAYFAQQGMSVPHMND